MIPLNGKLIDAAKLLYTMRFTGGFIHNGQIYVPLREVRQAIRNAPAETVKTARLHDEGRETDVLPDR